MICEPCKEAGEITRIANQMITEQFRGMGYGKAMELHLQCPGGCGCQHVIGQVINNGNPS